MMMPKPVSISIFLFLALFIHASLSLSFDMSPITVSDSSRLILSGDAYVNGDGIQVTPNDRGESRQSKAGRATYGELLHLWDKASQNVADFSTQFSLVIDSFGSYNFGDGLAFFLAPNGSTIKPWYRGSGLGLGNITLPADPSSSDTFVAVEFDTYSNVGIDPASDGGLVVPHVGIDLNSLASVTTKTWYNNISAGSQSDASITYNSTTNILTVAFSGTYGGKLRQDNLFYQVDLRHYLPEYVTVGFSAATGSLFQKNNVKSWNFSSTNVVSAQEPTPSPQLQAVNVGGGNDSKPQAINNGGNKKGLIFGLGGAAVLLLILASTCAFYFLSRSKNKKKNKNKKKEEYEGIEEGQLSDSAMDYEFEKGNGPKKFSYKELLLATHDFAEKLGEGGFGSVYKGFLKATNTFVAVKKVSEGSKQGRKEYEAEVKIISQLRHKNLVELIGWCHRKAELLLVYEFMPKGSLDSHLFTLNSVLTWEMRYRIAEGIASALLYLHEDQWRKYVVHRDIKASNVMLDNRFNAKLGDFGLARLVDQESDLHSTVPAGTIGYLAPEYSVTGKASKETDIYSLGIVLLEIACGRRSIDHKFPKNQVMLVEWVWNLYGAGQVVDAADAKVGCSGIEARKIERMMVVGLWCVHPDSGQRPSIRQIVRLLTSEDALPGLPPAMPKPVYDDTASRVVVAGTSDSAQGSAPSNLTTSSAGSSTNFLTN